jgi:uncharacterized protein with NRDE domain
MCTLILLHRCIPGWPLVVGSNRDEFFARPASPPALFTSDPERFVAPQDLQAGGTWMGVNARGLFVGITNRRPRAPPAADAPSRGWLVRGLLALPDVATVAETLERSDAPYAPFYVVASDGRTALRATRPPEGGAVQVETLAPGPHVVCNRDVVDPTSTKVSSLTVALSGIDWDVDLPVARDALGEVLRSHVHGAGSLDDACVHLPEYGTRCSAVVGIGPNRWHWWQAEGPPCQNKYQNYSRLLDSIQSQAPIS